MKLRKKCRFFTLVLIVGVGFFMMGGCDSGEKVVDEVTGNRAVKQYHKSKKDIGKIADQQEERYGRIPGEDGEDKEKE
jgi:hypothetical protein